MAKVTPVGSIWELQSKAKTDPNYEKLAIISANNLGFSGSGGLSSALNWLSLSADETSEEGVVDEINFCIDCL